MSRGDLMAYKDDRALNPTDYHDLVSKAYVELVAVKVGYEVVPTNLDRTGVDLSVRSGGEVFAQVDIQCKGTSHAQRGFDGNYHLQLSKKQYDVYRIRRSVPLWLVLVCFPGTPDDCITVTEESIELTASAYYVSPRHWEVSENKSNVTVAVPEQNRFDDRGLRSLMELAADEARQ